MNLYPNHTVKEVIESNYLHGAVFHYFGITVHDYQDYSLEKLCSEKRIDLPTLVKRLEQHNQPSNLYQVLFEKDLKVVLAYLKYAHKNFIKVRLPYLKELIDSAKNEDFHNTSKASDLKFVFPIFVEDFIRHIYEEEDSLFQYISMICENGEKKTIQPSLFLKMQQFSLAKFQDKHLDEDEMAGIRELTDHYTFTSSSSLTEKMIYSELRTFDHDLKRHALIENDVLVPKAMEVEQEVLGRIAKLARLN